VLPQDDVDDDRHLTRGARVRDLAQTLTALHQKDFGDLLGGDEVRYDIVGAETLEPGHVEVRFGHAVYLPGPGEKVLYAVSASRDSAVWKPVCPIYPNQRLTVIGQDESSATHAVPGWPFGTDGAILLVNDGPEAPVEVQVRPKDAFGRRGRERRANPFVHQARAHGRANAVGAAGHRAACPASPVRPTAPGGGLENAHTGHASGVRPDGVAGGA
jgi:hypothetical protein